MDLACNARGLATCRAPAPKWLDGDCERHANAMRHASRLRDNGLRNNALLRQAGGGNEWRLKNSKPTNAQRAVTHGDTTTKANATSAKRSWNTDG